VLLAVFKITIDEALARVNPVKNVINGAASGVAALGFALFAPVG
jgi:hypothetical protein